MTSASSATNHDRRPARPVPNFQSRTWRVGDAIVSVLARAGIGPMHVLTTRGRRTGRARTTPVVPVVHDSRSWLVAPYGPVSWVHNARASGTAAMRHGRTNRRYRLREVGDDEAGPVLKRYVSIASKTREHFRSAPGAPVEEFTAEAGLHPVFELIPEQETEC